uniref:Minor capsid protein n=1 Tax=Siphoviridae sp. ctbxa26 TaxID=2825568 RepID=A0A8S5VEQ8_9CAUD|nr:MAG TPA: minor capsid protein [Siphoviridae sp. ctbxa26]
MNYWEQRTKQLNKSLENDEERLKRRLVNYYRREAKRLDKEIASFYQRYGENNIIEYRKLLQQMSSDDIQLLYEDMDEFARKYPQYSHLMPTRANIYKLTRLEGLQQSVYMAQLRLGAITDIELTAHLEKQAKRYGRAADTANGKVFNMINEQTVKGFVNTEWSNGKNFSQRIWDNAQKLADTLNTELAQGFARGEAYEKLTKQITDKFETVSRNNAYRLIYTEGTYVMNESSIQGFSEDFEQYEYSVVEDGHACPICTALNGKVFNIKDRVPGVNFPPMHPWCRCTFKIHVDDWSEWLKSQSNKTRAQKVIERLSSGDGKGLTLITDSAINKVPLISTPKMTNAESLKLQALHKELLEYARDNNNSEEVAFLVNSKFEKFDVIKGDIESLDLTGKSAKYILHNHPNNSSFSLNDISYLVQNKPEFISLVTNRGKVELLELNEDFNKATFKVKFKRLKKKYKKDIANNKKKGYTKIAENLLNDKSLGFTLRS